MYIKNKLFQGDFAILSEKCIVINISSFRKCSIYSQTTQKYWNFVHRKWYF